jgi:hypothetical protein
MSSLPTIDQNTLSWIITSGLIIIIGSVVTAAVLIERRISRLEEHVKNLEENPLFVAVREFQIAQLKQIFKPEDMLKRWEEDMRNRLSKGGQNTG